MNGIKLTRSTTYSVSEPTALRRPPEVGRDRDVQRTEPGQATTSELRKIVYTQERIRRLLLVATDGCAALASVIGAALLTGRHPTWFAILLAPAVILLAKLEGLYDRDELVIRKSTLRDLPKLLEVAAVASVVVYFAREFMLNGAGTPAFFCLVGLLMFLALPLARAGARRLARRLVETERCLVVGDAGVAQGLKERIAGIEGASLVGAVPSADLPISPTDLDALVASVGAHRLIIAPEQGLPDGQCGELIHSARATGLRVSVVLGIMASFGSAGAVDQFGPYTLVGVPRFGLSRSSAAIKRTFDVGCALVAIVAFTPIMLAIALAIKLDTTGPVMFRQTRVGRWGRRFQITKFRSMVDGADAMKPRLLELNEAGDGMFKITADPRVTRVGAWLRRSRADELPQLFNVLRGEMSIVGPRPLVVEEDERIVGLDRRRLHLMPGMTGPWQILGTASLSIDEMANLDCTYVAKWTLWEDVCILLQTVGLVAGSRGV